MLSPFSLRGDASLDQAAGLWTLLVLFTTGLLYFLGFRWNRPQPVRAGKVTAIYIYPLKSARGVAVDSAALDERGLEFDRLWMVVDENGSFLSQRRAPKLCLVEAQLPKSHDEPLKLSAPDTRPLTVPVVRDPAKANASVRCWDDHSDAIDQGDEAAKWLSSFLGWEGARLVRMADGHRRQCDRHYAHRGSITAFSDGFPLLLASDASLADLNERLEARQQKAVPMNRFRPNLVVGDGGGGGAPRPWAEDGWARVVVGGAAAFGVVKPCSRCKMPTINQATGVPDKLESARPVVKGSADDDDEGGGPASAAEPTATLRTFRTGAALGYRKPGWKGDVFFGQNLVPAATAAGRRLAVGDAVVATPRRPRGWYSRGVRGVHYYP